jgi:hypothetical protein
MSAIKLSTPSSGSISLSPVDTASNLTITVPAVSATMATLTTPSFATTIGVGGATPAASGSGITFPATQSASTDPNTLDDYEEGTFSITWWSGISATGTNLGTSTNNRYTKIGRTVTIAFARQGVGSGVSFSFSGLPFANEPNFGLSGVSADSVVFYADSPSIVTFRGSGDNTFCRGCFTYQTNT